MNRNLFLSLCMIGFVASCLGMDGDYCCVCEGLLDHSLPEDHPSFVMSAHSLFGCIHAGCFHAHCLASLLKEHREHTQCPICHTGLLPNVQHLPVIVQAHFPSVAFHGVTPQDRQLFDDIQALRERNCARLALRLVELAGPAVHSFRTPAEAGLTGMPPLARVRRTDSSAGGSVHETN
jgi:hypothetical protein